MASPSSNFESTLVAAPATVAGPPNPAVAPTRIGEILGRWQWAVVGALLAWHAVFAWFLREPAVGTGNDDALYLLLARSLRHLRYFDSYLVHGTVHSQYPPGYPALLAGTELFFGNQLNVLVAAGIVCSVLALLLVYDAVRRCWSPGVGLLVLLAAAVNPALVGRAGLIRSEPLYMLMTAVAFWAMSRPATRLGVWLVMAASIAAALTRSVGLTVLVAVGLVWLLERRWRRLALFVMLGGVTVGAWLVWTFKAPQQVVGRSYTADLTVGMRGSASATAARLGRRVYKHAVHIATKSIPSSLTTPTIPHTVVDNVFWLVLMLVLGTAGAFLLWNRWRVVAVYLGVYLGLLLAWPWLLSRFFIPLAPFFLLLFVAGAFAWERRWPRLSHAIAFGLVGLLCLGSLMEYPGALRQAAACDRSDPLHAPGCFTPEERAFIRASQFAREHLPPSAAVLTAKEATFAYYSGRRAMLGGLAIRVKPDSLPSYLRKMGTDYVLLGHLTPRERRLLSRSLWQICDRLALVESFSPETYFFRLNPPEQPAARGEACSALASYRNSGPVGPSAAPPGI